MSIIEIVILSVIVLSAVAGLVLGLRREKKNGGCCGSCAGCKYNCPSKQQDNQNKN